LLAGPPPANAALAQIRNSDRNLIEPHSSANPRSTVAIRTCVSTASTSPFDRLPPTQTLRPRCSNPHRARGTAARPPIAVSSLGGFRTPAVSACGRARQRPASETLHNNVNSGVSDERPLYTRKRVAAQSSAAGEMIPRSEWRRRCGSYAVTCFVSLVQRPRRVRARPFYSDAGLQRGSRRRCAG
jgi:hypothetical protein